VVSLKSLQLREPRNEKALMRKDERNHQKISGAVMGAAWFCRNSSPALPVAVGWTTTCPATSLGIPPRACPSPHLHRWQHPQHQPQLVQSRPVHLPTVRPPETWLGQDLSEHILVLTKVQRKAEYVWTPQACAAPRNLAGHAFKTVRSYQAMRLIKWSLCIQHC